MVSIRAVWLACATVVATLGFVPTTTGCTEVASTCGLARDCEACIRDPVCAWCFETGQCLVAETHCPGERAITLEQCEPGEH